MASILIDPTDSSSISQILSAHSTGRLIWADSKLESASPGGESEQVDLVGLDLLAQGDFELPLWEIQAHAYTNSVAANLSMFARLFGGDASSVTAGVIHEAKRFAKLELQEGRWFEVGVAVRLSVATTSLNAKLGVTIPNIAASAQIAKANARVGLTVVGYTGALGDVLPAPSRLDVETCVEYFNAFKTIQNIVFGEDSSKMFAPTILGCEEKIQPNA